MSMALYYFRLMLAMLLCILGGAVASATWFPPHIDAVMAVLMIAGALVIAPPFDLVRKTDGD